MVHVHVCEIKCGACACACACTSISTHALTSPTRLRIAWCASCSGGDGWLCACDLCAAPVGREGSIASKRWQPTRSLCVVAECRALCAAHVAALVVLLVVMMAGCVLVCSTTGRGREHCKQEMDANAILCHHAPQRRCRSSCGSVLFLQE